MMLFRSAQGVDAWVDCVLLTVVNDLFDEKVILNLKYISYLILIIT